MNNSSNVVNCIENKQAEASTNAEDSEWDVDKAFKEMSKAMTICVAYAANAGGTGTIIGTPVNMMLKGEADK